MSKKTLIYVLAGLMVAILVVVLLGEKGEVPPPEIVINKLPPVGDAKSVKDGEGVPPAKIIQQFWPVAGDGSGIVKIKRADGTIETHILQPRPTATEEQQPSVVEPEPTTTEQQPPSGPAAAEQPSQPMPPPSGLHIVNPN